MVSLRPSGMFTCPMCGRRYAVSARAPWCERCAHPTPSFVLAAQETLNESKAAYSCMGCRCRYVVHRAEPWCPRCGKLPWWRGVAISDALEVDGLHGRREYHLAARLDARTDCQRCGAPIPRSAQQEERYCNDCASRVAIWLSHRRIQNAIV